MLKFLRIPFLSTRQKYKATKYKVLMHKGDIEIRMYPRILKAKVSVQGPIEEAFTKGFKTLIDYFNGNNFKVKTMPVTGPVLQIPRADGWELDIFLPANMDPDTAPKPINRLIKFETIPSRKVAVMNHKGKLTQKIFEKKSSELEVWLRDNDFIGQSVARLARFKRHLKIPFFFKNEIQIDIN